MLVTGEEHQQRVAAEFDDVAAALLARGDHRREAAIEEIGEFLRSFVTEL